MIATSLCNAMNNDLNFHAEFSDAAKIEAIDLAEAPGGASLLQFIGYIYDQEAVQHMGRFLGVVR